MSLKSDIAAEAQRLGFSLFGVIEPVTPPHFDVYEDWLERERHGEMDYLATERARERRRDPGLILPGCQSILVLGWPHTAPDLSTTGDEYRTKGTRGRTASYAWGEDYHDLIPPRLEGLVGFIERLVGYPVSNRWYTDTGPILERDLAQLAGLGWIGKNTCLINPRHGSFILLAELFLGIRIEPDAPFQADHCGTCTRCIEACPTDCIQANRTLDASRCISYLTIELKGAIPRELRGDIGSWVFGCDICQQVCPWNQRFAPREDLSPGEQSTREPELIFELALSPRDFNQRFKGTPFKRTKRRGYLRNVAVALGNQGAVSAVIPLINALNADPEPLVRGHAAWALGRIGSEPARQALEQARLDENDAYVVEEITNAMGERGRN